MTEINQTFSDLLNAYSAEFVTTHHAAPTYSELRGLVPRKIAGVYIIEEVGPDGRILYIGSSGKIQQGMEASRSTIHSRIFGSSTPYHFEEQRNVFCYEPTTSGVPPEGYRQEMSLANIKVTCIAVESPKAPSVLEHLLIQGHINQYGDLPTANQKI